ncbi:MAG TPA: hypothetical protein DDX40_08640 [Rikenellaceae bacterium]|nr:hypothetical protein [Rikenellaceae bacterium]
MTISLLNIPTKSLSVITAGLAAGLGFAMKDILEQLLLWSAVDVWPSPCGRLHRV